MNYSSKDCWRGIKLCTKCEFVGYCSDQCRYGKHVNLGLIMFVVRDEDLPRHRKECELVSASGRRSYPHRAWFIARACIRVHQEGYNAPDRINKKRTRCFGDLMDRKS